ncbi:MAG: hypothetical protein JF614_23255 [Acidobacteria bacterium]|nr:hypothetical protein [Acidobacteriota bacterium]
MNIATARKWLVVASLSITGFMLLFCVTAPALSYPLEFAQSLRLVEIVVPVFFGYLGTATHFVFKKTRKVPLARPQARPLLGLLIKGPLLVYSVTTLAAILAFGLTNRSGAPPGSGMSVDELAMSFSILLGLLTVTTTVLVSYLFAAEER